jgi:3-deoxy-D-manno-octulosonic acid kinase
MTIKIYSSKKQHILYDADHLSQIDSQFFDLDIWRQQHALSEPSGGRGQAFFIQHPNGHEYLMRHYRRGGLIAKISQDKYWYSGLEHSRPWQEFKLTHELFQAGLPVAQPIAARVIRSGLTYQGDLVTLRIPNAQPFARYLLSHDLCGAQNLSRIGHNTIWQNVGKMIARFHRWGLNHVDLNANNILISADGEAWLIDFDRCKRMPSAINKTNASSWQQSNLQRLQRSICKLTGNDQPSPHWQHLQNGYTAQ